MEHIPSKALCSPRGDCILNLSGLGELAAELRGGGCSLESIERPGISTSGFMGLSLTQKDLKLS